MEQNQISAEQEEMLEKIRHVRNRDNHFANLIGLTVTEIGMGTAKTHMKVTKDMSNPIHSVHGGCLYTVADVTAGAAASSYGMQVTTMQSSMSYLRPGLESTELFGEAEVIKHGRRVSVVNVLIRDQTGTVLTQGTFQFMSLGRPIRLD